AVGDVTIVQGEALEITITGAMNLGGDPFAGTRDVTVDLADLGYNDAGETEVTKAATFAAGTATVELLSGAVTATLDPVDAQELTAEIGEASDTFEVTILNAQLLDEEAGIEVG